MSTQQPSSGDPQRMAREIEELEYRNDVLDARLANMETANDERIPAWVIDRCHLGEAPALVWREFRGMTRAEVAAAAGLPEATLEAIEAGKTDSGLRPMAMLARALRIDLDDLVPWAQESDPAQ